MKPPYLVSTDCFFEAYYNNCNASFMQVGTERVGATREMKN